MVGCKRPKTTTTMENENEQVHADTSEQHEDEVDTSTEETTEDESNEETDWEAKARKAEELANNYKRRAEKAEQKAKGKAESVSSDLSSTDILAIAKADIHEEDIDRVMKFAKMEGISVKDALGNDDMQAILERRAEARKVAAATNTGKSRNAATSEQSDDILLANARNGKMPDADNLDKLFEAQLRAKQGRR